MKKILLVAFLFVLLTGCAGSANFKESSKVSGYEKTLSDQLLIIFETSHLRRAFTQGNNGAASNPIQAELSLQKSSFQVTNQLIAQLREQSIIAVARNVDLSIDRSQIDRQISQNPQSKQILLISADSFPMVTQTRYGVALGPAIWSGQISWSLRLLDRDEAALTNGKPVWSAKTSPSAFSPWLCSSDEFKTCAQRFSESIINQLKQDQLIRSK
jgi:hypothetical protein